MSIRKAALIGAAFLLGLRRGEKKRKGKPFEKRRSSPFSYNNEAKRLPPALLIFHNSGNLLDYVYNYPKKPPRIDLLRRIHETME